MSAQNKPGSRWTCLHSTGARKASQHYFNKPWKYNSGRSTVDVGGAYLCDSVRNHISISSTTTHPISLWIHQLTYTKPSWTQIRLFITPHMYIHGLLFRGISKISIHCNGKIKPNMWRKLNHTTCLTHENQLNVFLHVYPGEISLKISNKMFW